MKNIAVAASVAALIATATLAHAEVTNPAVKARMDAMGAIGGSMKTLGGMAKGSMEFDAAQAQAAIDTIAENAAMVPALFEANETDPESEAAPAIWTNWDDFLMKSNALTTAAQGVTITDQASIGAAMGAIGGTCKACHSDYKL